MIYFLSYSLESSLDASLLMYQAYTNMHKFCTRFDIALLKVSSWLHWHNAITVIWDPKRSGFWSILAVSVLIVGLILYLITYFSNVPQNPQNKYFPHNNPQQWMVLDDKIHSRLSIKVTLTVYSSPDIEKPLLILETSKSAMLNTFIKLSLFFNILFQYCFLLS